MADHGILFVREIGATTREALVPPDDLDGVRDHLAKPPGGLEESPAAAEALRIIDNAAVGADEVRTWQLPDQAAMAIHWALERMMADGVALSASLHTLRDVVAPPE